MPTYKDNHGQPHPILRARHNVDRSMDELIGLCKGIAADGRVNQEEADYLCHWLQANDHVREVWPADILRARVVEYLEDGHLDIDEKEELFELLNRVAANRESHSPVNLSTALPFDSPLPEIRFHGWPYCLTGRFNNGPRSQCHQFIESLGGVIIEAPRKSGFTLVVGELSSRDWIHSTHGRKIEAAVNLRRQGLPVAIIPEYHWYESVCRELKF